MIPSVNNPEIYEEVSFIDSKFVKIEPDDLFHVEMKYPIMGMKNAEKGCFVREEVYKKLVEASKNLPEGYRFKIFDAWRPFLLQHELYEVYSAHIIREFGLERESSERRNEIIRHFVSDPVRDEKIPPVHTTGGAIDLTIEDEYGNELEMGTEFDAFTDKTYTDYFEKDVIADDNIIKIRDNRRLLYKVMTEQGFTNLPSEWWHFDYGDRFWAYYNKKPALYKGIFTKGEIK